MKNSTWQQAKEIFDAALDLAVDKRAAFVESSCSGNGDLRKEVEKLLGAYDSEFLEDSVFGAAEALVNPVLTTGQVIGRYHIKEQIGTGGMGQVFLADDTELNRPVAFKVLHGDVSEDTERVRRFIQEARAASALNHPNILTIHEVGSFEGSRFIVSEYVDGDTLRERMRSGLTVAESVEITCQIAAALQAAHAAAIVHRDIKPENVMIRNDGLVKVLDFGLAKLTEADDHPIDPSSSPSIVHTSPGLVMGTVAYMSPEQARGQAVDARTDLWSLGVVLHEMLTGKSPFEGESVTALVSSILSNEVTETNIDSLPPELTPICQKALTKDKQQRYQSAHDLLEDLKGEKKRMEYAIQSTPYVSLSDTGAPKTQVIRRRPTLSAEYLVTEIKRHKLATFLIAALVVTFGIGLSAMFSSGFVPAAPVNPESNTWVVKASFGTASYAPTAGAIDGKLYVVGGDSALTLFRMYDPITDVWTTKAPFPASLYFARAGVINGKLYVAGGLGPSAPCGSNTLYVYDPANDTWTAKAPMPIASGQVAAAGTGNKLYVAGGNAGCGVTNALQVYDSVTDTWSLQAPMPTARYTAMAGVVNGKVYVAGGGNGCCASLATNEMYDPLTDTWATKSPMPSGRNQAAGAAINRFFYVSGGIASIDNTDSLFAYDALSDSWTAKAPLNIARGGHAMAAVDGKLYAVAGNRAGGAGLISSLEVYTPDAPPPCSAGTYDEGQGCIEASPGYYVPTEGATSQTACPAGSYQPSSGASSCIPAPAGKYVAHVAATLATDCSAGSFQPNTESTSCLPAPAGKYVDATGAIFATHCPAGSFQPNTGSTLCLAAPVGAYVDSIGAIAATDCPAGTYQPGTGSTACLQAPAGTYVAMTGAANPTPCPPGSYQPNSGSTSCVLADPGFFVPVNGSALQTPCSPGYVSAAGATVCTPTPVQAIQNLMTSVSNMGLPTGVANSLSAPLKSLDLNNPSAACGKLGAFLNQVNAKQTDGQLTIAQADHLRQQANAVRSQIGCT